MNREQAREKAAMLRAERRIAGGLPSDDADWLWQYENGFISFKK